MITLFFAPTTNGRRAAVALSEAGLAYRIFPVRFDNKPAELFARNPGGTIPVIEDPDGPDGETLVLNQSGAIVLYLSRKIGRFIPAEPRARAMAEQWLMFACSDIAGTSSTIFASSNDVPEPFAANTGFFEKRLFGFFRTCDQHLAGRSFLVGDEFTIADIALYPVYAQRKALASRYGSLPHLARWGETIGARPAVMKAMALTYDSIGVQQ